MTRFAYVNGDVAPVDEATVGIRDRGFLFGDGVYDVVRIIDGEMFRLGRHLDRLRTNAQQLELEAIPTADRLREIARHLVDRSDLDDGKLYVQLTRGSGPRQSSFPDASSATVVAYVDKLRRGADQLRSSGASIILVPEIRWKHCNIKSTNLLPKVLMSQRASRSDCYEAVFISDQDAVWEGTSTNLFVVDGGTLRTTDHPSRVLPGLTRREVIEIAAEQELTVELSTVFVDDLYAADEVFLTGTLTEVLGVTEIDGTTVGGGDVGPVTRQLQTQLQERMHRADSG
jgi:D-alanine transaminase